jgi:hypothetical protein
MKPLFLSLSCVLILLSGNSFQPKDEWTPLLDKNLSKWNIYQSFRHKLGYKGEAPKDENGNLVKPIGYNINQDKLFSMMEENGELLLHIDGDIYGDLFTKEEYGNYDLKLK